MNLIIKNKLYTNLIIKKIIYEFNYKKIKKKL